MTRLVVFATFHLWRPSACELHFVATFDNILFVDTLLRLVIMYRKEAIRVTVTLFFLLTGVLIMYEFSGRWNVWRGRLFSRSKTLSRPGEQACAL
jgi:hypothetical protein